MKKMILRWCIPIALAAASVAVPAGHFVPRCGDSYTHNCDVSWHTDGSQPTQSCNTTIGGCCPVSVWRGYCDDKETQVGYACLSSDLDVPIPNYHCTASCVAGGQCVHD